MNQAELGDFLIRASLYRSEIVENPLLHTTPSGTFGLVLPKTVTRNCERCQHPLTHDRTSSEILPTGLEEVSFQCRNCKGEVSVFVRLARGRSSENPERFLIEIEKVGQYPKLEVQVPKEFADALGGRILLYRKGMTARHNNYGIGALTYFRRLIEDTTDEMLDLLEEAMKETGADAELLQKLSQAKTSIRFEEKVKLAAEVMPPALRPGGVNPFGDLYDLLSVGLHQLSDEECCDIVDDMDRALKFIYTHLKAHTEDAKAYVDAAKDLHAKVQRLKRKEGS